MEMRLKRLLSLFLAFVMVLGMMPTNVVFAEENTELPEAEVQVEETTAPATEPEETTEPVTEPEKTTEPVTEPAEPTEPVTEPEEITEPVTEPEETTEPVTEPEETTEPVTEPEEKEPVEVGPVFTTVTAQIVPEVDLPDNDELFAYFAESKLYGYDAATFGTTARADLTRNEQIIYDALKEEIERVAANGGSAEFVLSEISGLQTRFTNTELGVTSIVDEMVVDAAFASQFNMTNIVAALLTDCPFDLYWYDKTVGAQMTYTIGVTGYDDGTQAIWDAAEISNLTFRFAVSADYRSGEYRVTTNVAKISTARNTASQVVAANAGKSDYEKLVAYKNYICDAVSYDHAAAENENTPYGDPWQLISVFDGSDSTNVVCEGYAKAFQYLCDLSSLDCISVSGIMGGGTGAGRHMWNVVTLEGAKYLVDVTNSDAGSVGQNGGLFLVGGTYVDGCYSFTCDGQTVYFSCDDLGLSADDYVYEPPVTTYAVTVASCVNGTVTAEPANAAAGTQIQLTVTPAINYTLKTLTVTWGDDLSVDVADNKFVMPAGDVTVTAIFEKAPIVSGTTNKTQQWTLDADGVLTITGTGAMINYGITGAPWYEYRSQIKSVVIGNGITTVGTYAFFDCGSVTSVTIPSSVTSIGNAAFYNCVSLLGIVIPSGVTSLGNDVFYGCTSLDGVNVPSSVTKMGYGVFEGCSGLTSVTIPASVTSLNTRTFNKCTSLTSYTIPAGVTEIGSSVFSGCSSLSDITIPDTVTTIESYAFNNCISLTDIEIPDSVTSIGNSAFYNCSNLKSITIPAGVTSIESFMFYNCTSLTDVTIPDGVTAIASYAFSGCSSLTEIDIPDTVTGIGTYAFYKCSNLTGIEIPSGVTSIEGRTFYNCSSLSDITIPSSVTNIGEYAFYNCAGLTEIDIPDGVTEISSNAFGGCTGLTGIEIPSGVTNIGTYAFYYCTGLTDIEIPAGVTSIGNSAFYYCKNLTSIVIPSSVTSIGSSAFSSCSKLTEVYYGADAEQWETLTNRPSAAYVHYSCTDSADHWEAVEVTVSCETDGYTAEQCACGYERNKVIAEAAWGHTEVIDEASDPTCGEPGKTQGSHCETCGKVLVEQTVTGEALGHYVLRGNSEWVDSYSLQNDTSYPFTFSNDWYTSTNKTNNSTSTFRINAVYDCTLVLGYKVSSEANYDKLTVSVNSKTQDTISGNIAEKTLTLSLKAGDIVYIKYSKDVSQASGSDAGYFRIVSCSQTDIGTVERIPTDELEPTCEESVVCDDCHQVVKPMLGHTEVVVPAVPPTCTADGMTEGKHCSACGKVFSVQTVVEAQGHNYEELVTDPTCELDGYTTHTCSGCGDSYTDTPTAATGHTEVTDEAADPTCTQPGMTEGKHCSVCNKVLVEQTVLDALGHYVTQYEAGEGCYTLENDSSYPFVLQDGWHISTNKSDSTTSTFRIRANYDCTLVLRYNVSSESNYDKLIISVNSTTKDTISGTVSDKTMTLPLLAGDIVNIKYTKDGSQSSGSDEGHFRIESCEFAIPPQVSTDDVEPTCEESVVCDSCHQVIKPKLGHTEVTDHAVAATCTTNGLTEGSHCATCGKVFVEQIVILASHNYVDSVCTVCALPDGLSYTISGENATVTGYTGTAASVVIPATIEGKPVTSIGSSAFGDCSSLTEIVIPDSVTSIGSQAFKNCSSLSEIEIPTSVTSIGSSAFYGCSSLKKIYIPANVTTIYSSSSSYALFYGCSSDLVICCAATSKPSGWGSYWNYHGSGSLNVKYGWTKADYDFWANLNPDIEELVIPETVTTIPNKACYNFTKLKSVVIPSGVTGIGYNAFYNCTSLKSIYIPASVTTISANNYSESPFNGCASDLVIFCEATAKPSGWSSCWNYYKGGYSLTVYYGSTMVDYEFWTNLDKTAETVIIPDGVTFFPAEAFANCTNLKTVIIPDSVTYIGSNAFENCTGLERLYIPASVTTISAGTKYDMPFQGCSNLTVYCEAKTAPSGWGDYWQYNDYGSNSVNLMPHRFGYTWNDYEYWPDMENTGSIIELPDTISHIPDSAFYNCTDLESIIIPESVTSIGDYAFYGCTGLTSVTLPEGVTSIGDSAFYGCTGLTEIILPENVTSIGSAAFSDCTGLTSVTIPEGVISIGDSAFYGCTGLTEIILPENVTSIGNSAFNGCTNLTSITIPEGVTSIGKYTFYGCTDLKTVYIPASVTSIGYQAFRGCYGLRDLYFGHTAADTLSFDSDAFYAYNADYEYFPLTIHVPTIRNIHSTIGSSSYYRYYTVTYDYSGDIPVTSIELSEAYDTTVIEAGLELNFTATLTPFDCTSELVWTASNGGVVKTSDYVSGTATVVGTQPGIMTVRCESADDNSVFAEYQVEILPPSADVERIEVYSDTQFENEVEDGTQVQMIAELFPGNAAIKEVTWELENGTGTAELDENGLLTALTTGTVTVFATSTDGTEITGSATVNIVRYVDDLVLLCNDDPAKTTIGLGETVKVRVERFPEDATATAVTWTLTDGTGEVTRDSYGDTYIFVTGTATGTATVTATAKDNQKTTVSLELEVVGEKASYPVTGGNIYYNTETGAIVGADSTVTAANIPARINGTTITSIAAKAFVARDNWGYITSNTALTSVTIPNTVTYIGDRAFYYCHALASLRLGNSVKTIDEYAFYDCESLANLAIPESVTAIGYRAFYYLSNLKTLTMSGEWNPVDWLSYDGTLNTLTLTGTYVRSNRYNVNGNSYNYFTRGRNAKNVIISDTVTAIEEYAFSDCHQIETVTMGNNVASIGEYAFAWCDNLSDINLSEGLQTIGNHAFWGCDSLTSINLPDGLMHIGEYAFSGCDSLASINLPDSLTHIGKCAFGEWYDNDSLQILDISAVPDTITQQNFPLTDDLVVVPEVLVSATGGKVSLEWRLTQDFSSYHHLGSDKDGTSYLYIDEPGEYTLICIDEYTGATGSKVITCELGLEIDGLYSNYLTAGTKVRLTARRMPDGEEENVRWSLREQDKAYASLSASTGKYTDLTVKSVSKATQIQITATSNVPGEPPETRAIWILPKTTGISITNKETGEVLGKSGTSAKTIKWDLQNGSLTLAATTTPQDASAEIYWTSSNYNVAEVDYEGIIVPKQPGTVTITAHSTDGSGKTASFKLQVYYVDTATKLTAKAEVPSAGLEVLDTAPIHVYGTDKQNPLSPEKLSYYIPDDQLEFAEIDEETGILTALKPGTVTVTASIKDDPLARTITVKVKVIPALTESVFLTTQGSEKSQIVMLDHNGDVTTDPAAAAKYRVYLDKEQMSSSDSFVVTAAAIDSNGNPMELSGSSMKWATTDKRIATVTVDKEGIATVKVNANIDGACVITATSNDLAKVEGALEVFVRDYTPRLEATSLTMNSYLDAGITVGLTPAYGTQIDPDVEVLEYVSSGKPYESTDRFTAEYDNGILTIWSSDVVNNGTYKLKLCVDYTTETGTPMTSELALSVKVSNKLPSITLKQSGKFNLFYTDSTAAVAVTVKDCTVTDAWIDAASTASFQTSAFDAGTSVMSVEFTPEHIEGTAGKLDSKVNVLIELDGYRVVATKALTLSTTTAKPSVSLSAASSIINTALAGEHSTTFRVYNKTDDAYMDVAPEDVDASFADVSVHQENVKLTLKEGVTVSSKGVSAKVTVQESNWMSPITLTHKVTVQKTLPTVKFSVTTLKLNRVFAQQTASTTVSLSQQNMAIGDLLVEPADTKAATRTEALKIGYDINGGEIRFRLDKGNLPKNGAYTFRVTAMLDDGVTKLAAKTVKVTVGSTVPTVKLTTPTLKLNNQLGKDYAIATSAYSLTKADGYEFVRFDLPADWSNQDIDVRYDTENGLVTAVLRHDNALTGKKGKHTVALTPVLRDVATGEVAPLPTTVKLTVQVESKTPSVSITTKGKLDVNLPDSEIIYTVKSFSNVPGSPTNVTLEGTHSDLFAVEPDESGTVVTLKMREGLRYNPKTTYKVTLVFHISGQQVRKAVTFKVAQTALKLAAVPTLRLYQSQTQPMKATLKVSAPAGAAIDRIELNSKTPYQFRRALGTDNMKVKHLPDGTVEVEFDFEHPGYLTYGKSYTVYLDVFPVSTAETVKATQIKLTVKSYK